MVDTLYNANTAGECFFPPLSPDGKHLMYTQSPDMGISPSGIGCRFVYG